MKPSVGAYALAGLVAFSACAQLPAGPHAFAVEGVYLATGSRQSRLEIRRQRLDYVIDLVGGSDATRGAASAADCHVRAIGRLQGDRLVAEFAGVKTESFHYSPELARAEQRKLVIEFEQAVAKVVLIDTVGYCGLDIDFIGSYRRSGTSSRY